MFLLISSANNVTHFVTSISPIEIQWLPVNGESKEKLHCDKWVFVIIQVEPFHVLMKQEMKI